MDKIVKWYTIERHGKMWVVWLNKEGKHSYGSLGIYRNESKKECENYCKQKGIKIYKKKKI